MSFHIRQYKVAYIVCLCGFRYFVGLWGRGVRIRSVVCVFFYGCSWYVVCVIRSVVRATQCVFSRVLRVFRGLLAMGCG